jgi:hypothetical protein
MAAPGLSETNVKSAKVEKMLNEVRSSLEQAKSQLVVATRAEQIARIANESLQQTLREREEEIAGLRADLGFYQRLVGGQAARAGLTVHAITAKKISDSQAYSFELTLTQNMKKGAVIVGRVTLAIEGVREQQLVTLDAAQLGLESDSASLSFSFKYFQKIQGRFTLPEGFTPNRILVNAKSDGGEQTQQVFTWADATTVKEENDHVR